MEVKEVSGERLDEIFIDIPDVQLRKKESLGEMEIDFSKEGNDNRFTKGTLEDYLDEVFKKNRGARWIEEPATYRQADYIKMAISRGWLTEDDVADAFGSLRNLEYELDNKILSKGTASGIIEYIKDKNGLPRR